MRKIKQAFKVFFDYPVFFDRDVFATSNRVIADTVAANEAGRRHRVACFVEQAIVEKFPHFTSSVRSYCQAHSDKLELAGDPIVLEGGEALKSFADVEPLLERLAQLRLCRHSFVLIVGGGAFLDTVGLAASLAHRGVRQIRLPTTVLSQCDSGVGVKNGVNMFGQKNYAGVFAPPFAVVCDFNFLDHLDQRDWIAGVAEAFKVSLIKDADFFEWLCGKAAELAERSKSAMEELVARCAEIHLHHIATCGDPFEFGPAKPLDFGHWAAHRLEMMSEGAIRHGEAVSIGLALDCRYAVEKKLLDEKVFAKFTAAAAKVGLPLWSDLLTAKEPDGSSSILKGLDDFREHLGGDLSVTMPNGLGAKTELGTLDANLVMTCVEQLRLRYAGKRK